jgi:hypothetical protein
MPPAARPAVGQDLACWLPPEIRVGSGSESEQIERYIASGSNLFDRDVGLIKGIQKIETEALNPVDLRAIVIDAIDSLINTEARKRAVGDEETERDALRRDLGALAKRLEPLTDEGAEPRMEGC